MKREPAQPLPEQERYMVKLRTKKREHERDSDPWFNPYRWPESPAAKGLVWDVMREVEKRENRKRKRTEKDNQWFWQLGHVLVADLAYHYLCGSPGNGLVVPRAKRELGKQSRYHPPYFTRRFPTFLDTLQSVGYLRQKIGVYSGEPGKSKRTTIRASVGFIELVEKHKLTFNDLTLSDAEEVIILKRAKRSHWDEGEKIPYRDTATTERLRTEVREVNAWLERADIAFDPRAHDRPVDVQARRLYRYFAADFRRGGRLFRGFWQNLPKPARLLGLRIQGERVIGLDYAQLNPTLTYAKVGCSPPSDDAYTLPGLEQHREGVKKVFNALLFDKGPRKSFPVGVRVLFPKRTKIGDVISAIREKHPMIGSLLSSGSGFDLMFRESEMMMRVLEELRSRGIVGLPVFDAVIVKASEAQRAMAVMKKQFKKATGLEIEVRLERAVQKVRGTL